MTQCSMGAVWAVMHVFPLFPLDGAGLATIDGEDIELTTGDWLRVSPAAHRQLRTAADSGITYVCIQVKQGSLGAFTADDAIMC